MGAVDKQDSPARLKEIKISSQAHPKDIWDWLLGFILVIVIIILWFLPGTIILLLTGNANLVAFVTYGIAIVGFLFIVWSISITNKGIKFNRVFGKPQFLEWKSITSIRQVSRSEALFKGFLSPYYFRGGMSASMSTKNCFRIEWNKKHCYFCPKDAKKFQEAIADHAKHN